MVTQIQTPAFILGFMTRVPKQKRGISLVKWLKADAEMVAEGEAVVILDTRKAAVEVAAQATGLLFHLMEVNEKVEVGSILGVVVDSVEEFRIYREQSLTKKVA